MINIHTIKKGVVVTVSKPLFRAFLDIFLSMTTVPLQPHHLRQLQVIPNAQFHRVHIYAHIWISAICMYRSSQFICKHIVQAGMTVRSCGTTFRNGTMSDVNRTRLFWQ